MVYRRVQKILINSVKRSFKLVKFWIFITLFLTSLFYFETTFWEIYSTPVDVLPVQVLIFSNPNDDKQSTSFSQQELETCSLPYSILPTNDITEKPTIALDALYKRFNSWHSKGDWNIPLIIFADGRDVLFNPYTTKQFITQFNALDSSIVLSAEPNCAPPEFCRNKPFGFERYQNIVGSDFYVNSGLIGGNIVSLLYAYLWMQEFTDEYKDDQSKLHEFFLHHRNSNKIYNLKSKYWTKHMADLMEANEKSHLVLMDTAFVLFDTLARHTFYYAPLNASSDTYSVNNFKKPGCNATGKARHVLHKMSPVLYGTTEELVSVILTYTIVSVETQIALNYTRSLAQNCPKVGETCAPYREVAKRLREKLPGFHSPYMEMDFLGAENC